MGVVLTNNDWANVDISEKYIFQIGVTCGSMKRFGISFSPSSSSSSWSCGGQARIIRDTLSRRCSTAKVSLNTTCWRQFGLFPEQIFQKNIWALSTHVCFIFDFFPVATWLLKWFDREVEAFFRVNLHRSIERADNKVWWCEFKKHFEVLNLEKNANRAWTLRHIHTERIKRRSWPFEHLIHVLGKETTI